MASTNRITKGCSKKTSPRDTTLHHPLNSFGSMQETQEIAHYGFALSPDNKWTQYMVDNRNTKKASFRVMLEEKEKGEKKR